MAQNHCGTIEINGEQCQMIFFHFSQILKIFVFFQYSSKRVCMINLPEFETFFLKALGLLKILMYEREYRTKIGKTPADSKFGFCHFSTKRAHLGRFSIIPSHTFL